MKKTTLLFYGFSIFSMFFGSGNLVYPLQVGIYSPENWVYGYLGFFCSGIILPFCGVFAIKLYKGDYSKFFGGAGRIAGIIVPLVTLSLLGSFGVIPRCITVAHGGFEYAYPGTSLLLFSVLFSICSYIFCLKDRYMFRLLGQIVTPLLVGSLIILILVGIVYAFYQPKDLLEAEINKTIVNNVDLIPHGFFSVFNTGFTIGYNTMDLLAAFFFSSLIFKEIEKILPSNSSDSQILKAALKPSICGIVILAIVYLGFVYLGALYKDLAVGINPETILPAISTFILGRYGAFLISVIIIFSCITTAVALNQIYAKYLCNLFRLKDNSYPFVLALTTLTSFCISTLDFNGISKILGPILNILYPALIVLTLTSIFFVGKNIDTHPWKKYIKPVCFYGVILIVFFLQ